jgi:disulfide bond formation protein DsbB
MIFYLQTFNLVYALGGLALLGATLVLFYDYYLNAGQLYTQYVSRYVWVVLAVVVGGGVASTLLYSDYFGFVPCSLCWLQRIALYPQLLMVGTAFRVKDYTFFPLYGIVISIFGFLVAVYHYIYQMIPKETLASGALPCLADGSADCADKVMNVFGFVTFPMLSAITFAFLIVIYMQMRRENKAVK